jgi:hypothetical protein
VSREEAGYAQLARLCGKGESETEAGVVVLVVSGGGGPRNRSQDELVARGRTGSEWWGHRATLIQIWSSSKKANSL